MVRIEQSHYVNTSSESGNRTPMRPHTNFDGDEGNKHPDSVFGKTPFEFYRKYFYHQQARSVRNIIGGQAFILDIGSGIGRLAEAMKLEMPEAKIYCTDIENYGRSDAPFVVSRGNALPFSKNSFDATIIFYVLHHVDDPEAILREAKRVSRGKVIVQEDAYTNLIEQYSYGKHIQNFKLKHALSTIEKVRTDQNWQELFNRSGLTVDNVRRIPRLNYPITCLEYELSAKGK